MTAETAHVATAVISLIGTMFSGIMAYLMAKLKKDQAEVKKTLAANEERMTALAKVTASTHRMLTPGTVKSLISREEKPKAIRKKRPLK